MAQMATIPYLALLHRLAVAVLVDHKAIVVQITMGEMEDRAAAQGIIPAQVLVAQEIHRLPLHHKAIMVEIREDKHQIMAQAAAVVHRLLEVPEQLQRAVMVVTAQLLPLAAAASLTLEAAADQLLTVAPQELAAQVEAEEGVMVAAVHLL